jgi:hypothetical protein
MIAARNIRREVLDEAIAEVDAIDADVRSKWPESESRYDGVRAVAPRIHAALLALRECTKAKP